jgi:hypothetical protein
MDSAKQIYIGSLLGEDFMGKNVGGKVGAALMYRYQDLPRIFKDTY